VAESRVTYTFILLFDLWFDKNGSSHGSGGAMGSGVLSAIVPNLLLSSRFAPFLFCPPARRAWAALPNFHAAEMAV